MIWTLLWKRLPIHPLLYADSPIPSLCVIQIGESYRFHVYNSNYNKILKVIRFHLFSYLVDQPVPTEAEHEQLENGRVEKGGIFHQTTLVLHHLQVLFSSFLFSFLFLSDNVIRTHRGDLKSGEANQSRAYDELSQSEQVYDPFQSVREPVNRFISISISHLYIYIKKKMIDI